MAKRKVKIKRLPKGYKMVNGSVVKTMALGGVPRDKANLEAEKGETVLTDLDNDGAHELYDIGGKRHSEGGTPLSLPPQSFIFSDTAKMKFSTDELAELGIDSKKKQTPAWASKKFKLNKFIKNMDNEHSDKISDETSELMLDKNKLQLSKIAFMSEAKKDFLDEEGNINVPLAAYPFLISKGIDPKEFIAKLEEIKAAKEQTQQAPLKGEGEREQAMQQPAPTLQDFTGGPQGPPMHQMPDGTMMPGATHEEGMAMSQGPQQGPPQELQQIIAKVIEALQQGMQPEQIMQQLVQLGIPEEQAMALLQKVIQDVQGQQGPPQGMSAQGPPPPMPPQAGPPQGGMPPMGPPMAGGMPPQGPPQGMMPPPGMAKYGGHPLSKFVYGGDPEPCYQCGGGVPKFQGERGTSEYTTDQQTHYLEQQCGELVIIREQLLREMERLNNSGGAPRDVIEGTNQKLQQVDRDLQRCMVENATPMQDEMGGLQQRMVELESNYEDMGTRKEAELRLIHQIHKVEMILQTEANKWPDIERQRLLQQLMRMKNALAKMRMESGEGQMRIHNNQIIPIPNARSGDWENNIGKGPVRIHKNQQIPMVPLKYGGDPFTTNPLHKFVYGGSLPKAQNSDETTDSCDPTYKAACEGATGTYWRINEADSSCMCVCEDEGLDWNGVSCVSMNGVIDDEDVVIDLTHDHDGDGIPDHEASEHVGESHGAKGDVAHVCTDVDENGNCVSYQTASNTHSTFEDVMRHEDFETATNVWWDVYTNGRKNMSSKEGDPFYIGDNDEHFNELDKEGMIDNYFLYNQILHDLNEHGLDPGDNGADFYKHAKSLGYFQNGETEDDVIGMSMNFQGMYRALNIAKRSPETAQLFTNIETLPEGEDWGEDSEHRDQWGNPVSSIDGKVGKTTKKQYSSAVNPVKTYEKEPPCPGKPADFDVEAARIACEKKNALAVDASGTTKGGVTDAYMWNAHNCECEHAPGDYIPPDRVPMIPWRQDQNNLTNSIMNKGLREDFYPMMEQYNFTPADMLRDDPLTRIHASNSLAQTAIDAGADPYTIFSQAAAENRKSIADVQSRDVAEYNALDKANMTAKQTIDQANMLARKQYVDDVNTVGTNRINTQIADNLDIVKQQNNLLTNAQNTQMMNQLRPNYNVDPQATPWNNQDIIQFANAKAYNDEVGGDGGGTGTRMTYAEAFAHASAPTPDGLGLEPAQANAWAKNYIASLKGNSSNQGGYDNNTAEDGYPARFGGERQRRRSGAALRQWMRGGWVK